MNEERATPRGYEFNEKESDVIHSVGRVLKMGAIFLGVFGAFTLMHAIDDFNAKKWLSGVKEGLEGALMIASWWILRGAKGPLASIGKTKTGNDIPKLIDGLATTRRAFTLWAYALLGMLLANVIYVGAFFLARHYGVHLPEE